MRPITIVLPVYGNTELVMRAISSVRQFVDLSIHKLIIVNDLGPDALVVRETLLPLVEGEMGIEYAENDRNLGFVGTCNRAVYELDSSSNDVLLLNSDASLTSGALEEMRAVLNHSEKHGAVAPRTNEGTIATFPSNPRVSLSAEAAYQFHLDKRELLPRYSIAPVAPGFCLLISRKIILNYGLFDEVFSPGYDEENDFCLRINEIGYSSVLANHAFVFHNGGASFRAKTRALQRRNSRVLERRYPHYLGLVESYFHSGIDPLERFIDYVQPNRRPSILIDCTSLGTHQDGTAKNVLSFLNFMQATSPDHQVSPIITILASQGAIQFYRLHELGHQVVASEDGLHANFDVGFALSPIWEAAPLQRLNAHCARIVVSHLDIIALRIGRLRSTAPGRAAAVIAALEWADLTIFLTKSAQDDVLEFDPGVSIRSSVVIHQGTPQRLRGRPHIPLAGRGGVRFGRTVDDRISVLVVGNSFHHKQVALAGQALQGGAFDVIVMAGEDAVEQNVHYVKSGNLSEEYVDDLFEEADVVIFSSAYEGFGLPIPQALQAGKPLILFDTKTSREVTEGLGFRHPIIFFEDFADLPSLLQKVLNLNVSEPKSDVRTLRDYNDAVFQQLLAVAGQPADVTHLRKRDRHFKLMLQSRSDDHYDNWMRGQLGRKSVRFARALADRLWGPIYQRSELRRARQASRVRE
jgi:GT2 family glycosyltransferase